MLQMTKLAYGYMQGLRGGAGIGAGIGLVKGLASGDSFGDVAKSTLNGAAAGGALGSLSSPLVNKARGMFGPKPQLGLPPMPPHTPPTGGQPHPAELPAAPTGPTIHTQTGIRPTFSEQPHVAPQNPAHGLLSDGEIDHLLSQLPHNQPSAPAATFEPQRA